MMKMRIYHGVLLCVVLTVCLLYWIGYPRVVCWLSVTLSAVSYVEPFVSKVCPLGQPSNRNTISSAKDMHITLNLVAKLQELQQRKEQAVFAEECELPKSLLKGHLPNGHTSISCISLSPFQSYCHKPNKVDALCPEEQHIICELKVNSLLPTVPDVLCHDVCQSPWHLGVFNNTKGHVTWSTVKTITKLKSQILHLINPLVTRHKSSAFCFIKCSLKETNKTVTQLLVLPPSLSYLNSQKVKSEEPNQQHGSVNFNIVVLEGMSRPQFWRQMPVSRQHLQAVQMSGIQVGDFEIVQTLDGLMELKQLIGTSDETLFRAAALSNYQTLWLDDGCHNAGVMKNISKLFSWMTETYVMDVGPGVAFCNVLSESIHEVPCFNGIPWHDYSLKFLRYYQAVMARFRQPYLSVHLLHIGSDHRKTAAVDESLAKHIEFMSHQEGTITVIISWPLVDLPRYPEFVMNGAPVVFHPIMFVILPDAIQRQLQTSHFDLLSNLINNQNRLVTTRDLFSFIKYFIQGNQKNIQHLGLLGALPVTRNCIDLSLNTAVPCICEGHQVQVSNNKLIMMMADYAVSHLNALLEDQFNIGALYLRKAGYRDHVVSTCRRLVGKKVLNITQALIQNHKVVTEMTITVEALITDSSKNQNTSSQSSKIPVSSFSVVLEHNAFVNISSLSINLRFVSYKRLGHYAEYDLCTGGFVGSELCLCQPELDKIQVYPINRTVLSHMSKMPVSQTRYRYAYKYFDPVYLIKNLFHQFGMKTLIHSVDPNAKTKCLYLIYRTYDGGASFEAVNTCQDKFFEIGFAISGENLCYSNSLAASHEVPPLSVLHIVTVIKHNVTTKWQVMYQVQFRENQL